jgi:hypothetical protein
MNSKIFAHLAKAIVAHFAHGEREKDLPHILAELLRESDLLGLLAGSGRNYSAELEAQIQAAVAQAV